MSKYGINVPKGAAASSVDEVRETIRSVFPTENEVIFLRNHTVMVPSREKMIIEIYEKEDEDLYLCPHYFKMAATLS